MSMYVDDFDQFLPLGNTVDKSAPGYTKEWDSADMFALVNYEALIYLHNYGLTEQHATCETARTYFEANPRWLEPMPATSAFVETTQIGWIYWGGRGDFTDLNTGKEYITAKKITDRPTSRTMATCFCYNRYDAVGPGGAWPAWYASHVRGRFEYAVGQPMDPTPAGLVVGYLDGATRFVKWRHLTAANHEGNYIVYYDSTY